jgi:type IX secretion system PorP/SprF family membrane protein
MIKNSIQITLILCFSILNLPAQDITFSQFFSSPTYLNPAFCGNLEQPRLALNYRNHVPSQNSSYITYTAYYDQYIDFLKGGVGGHFFLDQAGAYSQINFGLAHSFTVKLNRKYYLKSGFQYDFLQTRLNGNDLVFEDQNEVVNNLNSKIKVDFSVGFMLFDDDKFIGLKAAHLNQPSLSLNGSNDDEYNLKRTFSIHGGWNIPVEYYKLRQYEMSFAPAFVYYRQAQSNLLLLGSSLDFLNYTIGLFVRNNINASLNSFVFLLGVRLSSYKLAYSYDWDLSKYSYSNFGAHEISFAYIFETNDRKKKYKAIKCPSF